MEHDIFLFVIFWPMELKNRKEACWKKKLFWRKPSSWLWDLLKVVFLLGFERPSILYGSWQMLFRMFWESASNRKMEYGTAATCSGMLHNKTCMIEISKIAIPIPASSQDTTKQGYTQREWPPFLNSCVMLKKHLAKVELLIPGTRVFGKCHFLQFDSFICIFATGTWCDLRNLEANQTFSDMY